MNTTSISANEQAIATVEEFHAVLVEIMQEGDKLSFNARRDRLLVMIEQKFDMETIGRVVLNRHWQGLSPGQQQDFIRQFLQLSAATYASRFDSYSGQQFQTLGTEAMNSGRMLVRTEIAGPAMEPVKLDYILHEVESQWRIISVIADGVNDLALKRTEYGAIMNTAGMEQLLEEITAQTASLNDGELLN